MADTPKKPCRKCKRALTTGAYCDQCQMIIDKHKANKQKKYDHRRGTVTMRGYGGDWQKARLSHLMAFPLCECSRCMEMGRKRAANVVHHIKSVETYPGLRLEPANLMSMHHDCHEVTHCRARDREFEAWKRKLV